MSSSGQEGVGRSIRAQAKPEPWRLSWIHIFILRAFLQQLVLWCSWLSLLSNTQAVLSSSLSGIILLHLMRPPFFVYTGCPRPSIWMVDAILLQKILTADVQLVEVP
jgi:hypothetical protein